MVYIQLNICPFRFMYWKLDPQEGGGTGAMEAVRGGAKYKIIRSGAPALQINEC